MVSTHSIKRNLLILLVISVSFSLLACGKKPEKKPEPQAVNVIKGVLKPYPVHYRTVGTIRTDYLPTLKTYEDSTVKSIKVDRGEAVKKGQLLVSMDNHDALLRLKRALSEQRSASVKLEALGKEKHMKEELMKREVLSKLEYVQIVGEYKVAKQKLIAANETLKEAKTAYDRTEIRSPINGRVAKVEVHVGSRLQKGEKIISIANNHNLSLAIPVSQANIHEFHPGQTVKLYANNPKETVTTKLDNITPAVDEESGLLDLVVDFKNQYNWRIGGHIHATITLRTVPKTLVLPDSAVILRKSGYVIFAIKEGKAYEVPAKIIQRDDKEIAVKAAVKPNLDIVIFGGGYLQNGSEVTIKAKEKA